MKTKDAFALRGFDCNKIWDLKKLYSIPDLSTIPQQQSALIIALEELEILRKRCVNHLMRLKRYLNALIEKIAVTTGKREDIDLARNQIIRGRALSSRYKEIIFKLNTLKDSLNDVLKDNALVMRRIFLKTFSARLRQARKEAGLTQIQLADELGIKHSSYNAFETARNEPNISILIPLSKRLNRPVEWFLGL